MKRYIKVLFAIFLILIVVKILINIFDNDKNINYTIKTNKNKYKVVELPVSMKEREGGKSSINIFKSVDYMIKVSLAILIDSIKKR